MYNTSIMTFPNNILSVMLNFTSEPFFEVKDNAQREAVKVQF